MRYNIKYYIFLLFILFFKINNKLMLGNPLISNITKLNGIIPDIKLINGNNGDTVELYSLLKVSYLVNTL